MTRDDAAGELTSLTDAQGGHFGLSYDLAGNRTRITYPNGIASAVAYTRDDQVASITDTLGAASVASFACSYDAAGRRTSESGPQGNWSYSFDPLGRLTSATGPSGNWGFSYDAAGNIMSLQNPSGTSPLAYNAAGELTSEGSQTFSYDRAGNQVTAGTSTFAYDAAGEMTSSNVSGTSATYAYDTQGLRVASATGSTTTPTLWDSSGGAPVPVTNGATTFVDAGTTPLAQSTGSSTDYLLTDALGSVRDMTGSTGSVVGSKSFNPYGTVASQTGTASTLGYTGAISDATGLVYDQARYYGATTGLFTTRDPAYLQTEQAYAYAGDDPVNGGDPSGMCSWY